MYYTIYYLSLTHASECVPKGGFDLILANGLMHHLGDDLASRFLIQSYELLKPSGHLICFDGCIYEGQNQVKKRIVMADRGEYIRQPSHLIELVTAAKFHYQATIEENSLLIPYSLLVMSCKKQEIR